MELQLLDVYKVKYKFLTEEHIEHLFNIISAFLIVFGEREYIDFHNNYMLPLLNRIQAKYDSKKSH